MEEAPLKKKKIIFKALVFAPGFLAFVLAAYLFVLPFYPALKYTFFGKNIPAEDFQNLSKAVERTENNSLEQKNGGPADLGNRIIIDKIGVDAPIVEGKKQSALNRGAWLLPEGSLPSEGGNTIITGHRFKYLPPNNLTFYLLDKLAIGDIFLVRWENKDYYYRVREIKIISPDDLSILSPSKKPIITLFTCHPLWSQKNRLVVIGEAVD